MEHVETTQPQGQSTALAEGPKDEGISTTGIEILDELLGSCTHPGQAGILVCLELSARDRELGERITAAVKSTIEEVQREEIKGLDFECDVAPVDRWMAFLDGYTASRGTGDNADEPGDIDRDRIVKETVNVISGKEAAAETEVTFDIKKLREKEKQDGRNRVLKAIERFVVSEQIEILEAGLEEVHKITDKASRLNALKERVYRIYDGLDAKAKCAITVLQELAAVDGCGVDVDYGYKLLYQTGRDKGCVDLALAELLDDPDVRTLVEVYELSHFINQAV